MSKSALLFAIATLFVVAAGCGDDPEVCPSGGEMVTISAPNFGDGFEFEIDRYEASRFDASAGAEGGGSEIACSIGGVQPWREVSFSKASKACRAAGKRLCTRDEWIAACSSLGLENDFPYGRDYDPTACRTETDAVGATGSSSACKTEVNDLMDMSGNVREWVDGTNQELPGLAGGGFADPELNVTCSNVLSPSGGAADYVPGTGDGFRCCR